MSQEITSQLLEILLCPLCKGELFFDDKANELVCFESKLAYKIKDGIPILLIEQARKLD